jgi:hypothetical protein
MPRSPLTWRRRWRPVGAWRTGSAFGQFQAACEEFVDLGVPAAQLPDARGLRRIDLLARRG